MSKIVLTDFMAEWCGPCKMQDPIIEDLKKKFEGKVEFKKVNVDENPELANIHNIRAVPTIIIEKDGIVIKRYLGVTASKELEKDLNDAIEQDTTKKIIKVIMEYDDGSKEYIEGDDVEKWQKALNSALVLDFTHEGGSQDILKTVTWKKLSEQEEK